MTTSTKCSRCGQTLDKITPEDARAEAQKLMATEAYRQRNHPDHMSTLERVQQLFERAYSDEFQ